MMSRIQVSTNYTRNHEILEEQVDDEENESLSADEDCYENNKLISYPFDDLHYVSEKQSSVDISDVSSDESESNQDGDDEIDDHHITSNDCCQPAANLNKFEQKQLVTPISSLVFKLVTILSLFIFPITVAYFSLNNETVNEPGKGTKSIVINYNHVEDIPKKFPGLSLSSRDIRTIKTRLLIMQKEISVLMLIGQTRDTNCIIDKTFCVSQEIARSVESQSTYIDASTHNYEANSLNDILSNSFDENSHVVIIDSLEKLPGSHVMNIFQYIDRIEEIDTRKGLILFVVYTGLGDSEDYQKGQTAKLAEKVLVNNWSTSIPKDKLTSVISRMGRSIIKIY